MRFRHRILPPLIVSSLFALQSACGLHPAPRNTPVSGSRKQNIQNSIGSTESERQPAESPVIEQPSHLKPEQFDRFRREIQRFYRAPYAWGGASPAGTDCSGMIRTIYRRAADINLPHSTSRLFQTGSPVRARDLRFGDLVFFRFKSTSSPDHVGVYIDNEFFLHASVSQGVVLSRLTKAPYVSKYVGSKRILE
ncbi:C40 family peptidase [candidate division KSB1 bacterium]|nr:C40 family peptidase [candidate division KSB1 bacterium]